MSRVLRIGAAVMASSLALPAVALADDGLGQIPQYMHVGVSLLGMVVAIVLLIEAVGVRKIALGGAIAEKISYVVLAVACLAASALVEWVANFVPDFTLVRVQLASEALVIVAMALFAAYFYSVRSAMNRFLKAMTGQEHLAAEREDEWEQGQSQSAAPKPAKTETTPEETPRA